MKRRIKLLPDERELLLSQYRKFRVPTDQFRRRPDMLAKFVEAFNRMTERNDRPGEILRYMITQRKRGKWHTFDGNHRKLPALPDNLLNADEWILLGKIYVEMGEGSDELAYDDDLCDDLERRFSERASRIVSGTTLLALMMKKRKRGLLPCLTQTGLGFADIDEVARKFAQDTKKSG